MGGGDGVRRRLRQLESSPKAATARLLPTVDRRRAATLAVLVVLTGLAPVAIVLVTGVLVGSVHDALATGLGSAAGHRAVAALVALGVLFALLQAGTAARVAVADTLGLALEGQLEERVMRASMSPPGIAHLEDPAVLERISAAGSMGASGYRVGEAVAAMASRTATRLQGYGAALVLAGFHWWLALGVAAAWGWAGREQRRSVLETTKTLARQNALVRRAGYLRELAITPGAAKETRVFGLGPWLVQSYRAEITRVLTDVWRERARNRWQWLVATLLASAVSFTALLLLGRAAVNGEITIGALALYASAVAAAGALVHMGPDNHRLAYGTLAVPAVVDVERLAREAGPSARPDGGGGPGRPPPVDAPVSEIRFQGVSFRYPGGGGEALRGLDLVIPAGRSTAIVGANGAGKTTLVKLLCRFYEPDTGRITVDGEDLAQFDAGLWQRRIAALFQDFVHYPLTVAENIAVGCVDHGGQAEAVIEAARRAGAVPFIERLAAGFHTVLAPTRAGGTDLSGGQWQRVALARALFAVNAGARLLVLDEPAANLDVRAEADLYDRFLDLTRGLTTLVISHRFSTVRRADRIVVIEEGAVVEQGSHEELLRANGRYSAMYRVQVDRLAADRRG